LLLRRSHAYLAIVSTARVLPETGCANFSATKETGAERERSESEEEDGERSESEEADALMAESDALMAEFAEGEACAARQEAESQDMELL
jgi:hypothetical protein